MEEKERLCEVAKNVNALLAFGESDRMLNKITAVHNGITLNIEGGYYLKCNEYECFYEANFRALNGTIDGVAMTQSQLNIFNDELQTLTRW